MSAETDETTKKLRAVAIDHAAYNIAWGLQRIVGYSNASLDSTREGAEMLRQGLAEAMALFAEALKIRASREEKPE